MINLMKRLFGKESESDKRIREYRETYKKFYEPEIVYDRSNPVSLEEGKEYIVTQRAVCRQSIHEWNEYPRPGIQIEWLEPGDKVTFQGQYNNMYGGYARFKKDGSSYVYYIRVSISMFIVKKP